MDLDRIFEEAEQMMNDAVDEWLGDVVEVSNGAGAWTERKCFVFDESGVLTLAPIDSIDYRVRLKIDRQFVADPGDVRFCGGKLGDRVWKPGGDLPMNAGRYIVLDLQTTSR